MTRLTTNIMDAEEEKKRKNEMDRRNSKGINSSEETQDVGIEESEPKDGNTSPKISVIQSPDSNQMVPTDIPLVRIQQATPSPRPPELSDDDTKKEKKSKRRKRKDEKEEGLEEDDEFDDDAAEDDEDDDEEEEEVEEEEEETEMTQEEKKAMYEAVVEGDIDILEDCLDLPNADINMVWFQENLLMAAIRTGHVDVAEFLLDNGVDHSYQTSVLRIDETPDGKVLERYKVDCRQMAYDRDLHEIVFLIDTLQDNVFPFIPQPIRTPRLRRSKPEPSEGTERDADGDDESQSSYSDFSETSSDLGQKVQGGEDGTLPEDQNRKKKRKKKLHKKKRSRVTSAAEDDCLKGDNSDDDCKKTATVDEEDGDKDRTFRTGSTFGDVDSGNYSMASSKLKKSMLQKHDRLLEKEERSVFKGERSGSGSPRTSAGSPRKSEISESAQTKSQRAKGDKSDRTSTTVTHNEGHSKGGQTESVVPSMSAIPETPEWALALNPPTNRIRSTKASVATMQSSLNRNFYKSPLHASSLERPLHWRKVSTTGSYARESKLWHLERKMEEVSNERVQISPLKLVPSSLPSSPLSVVSSSASVHSKSIKPQSQLTTPSDVSESTSLSASSVSDQFQKSILKNIKPSQIQSSFQPQMASYMRPTQSTITKQRLGPHFVDSYGGLDFCSKPTPTKSANFNKGQFQKFSEKLQISGSRSIGVLSRSSKVPVLCANSGLKRRNHNTISYRV